MFQVCEALVGGGALLIVPQNNILKFGWWANRIIAKRRRTKCYEWWLTVHQRNQILYSQQVRQNGTKLTRSTETFGDLTPCSNTSPRRKPTTFQLWRLRFGKVQEGEDSRMPQYSWSVLCNFVALAHCIRSGYVGGQLVVTRNILSFFFLQY